MIYLIFYNDIRVVWLKIKTFSSHLLQRFIKYISLTCVSIEQQTWSELHSTAGPGDGLFTILRITPFIHRCLGTQQFLLPEHNNLVRCGWLEYEGLSGCSFYQTISNTYYVSINYFPMIIKSLTFLFRTQHLSGYWHALWSLCR